MIPSKVVDYLDRDSDFYDAQVKSINPLRAWFHRMRHQTVHQLVTRFYRAGDVVIDLACGNATWNTRCIPVVGVDINKRMLEHARAQRRISQAIVSDIRNVPVMENTADIVLATEILEHLEDCREVVREVRRILRPGGVAIVSVPYDTWDSLWRPLFAAQCFVQGTLFGDAYYANQCGHANHFSPQTIRAVFEQEGFATRRQFNTARFTIFSVFQKI
jgi:ubiquinone/menaquinone biosynthesis C-methylase UbiE